MPDIHSSECGIGREKRYFGLAIISILVHQYTYSNAFFIHLSATLVERKLLKAVRVSLPYSTE